MKDCIQDLRDSRLDELLEEVSSFCDRMCILVLDMEDKILIQLRPKREGQWITYIIVIMPRILLQLLI